MQKVEMNPNKLDFHTKEAYKTLQNNIAFSGSDIKLIAVTSCTPGEGKSSTSYQIAYSYALSGKKTLLIDADLRRSVMKQRHNSGSVRLGIVHYLVGKFTFDEVCCQTEHPDFNIVFSGPVPPNPSELLGNKFFIKLLDECRELYDVVIIDTPPIGSVIDAAVVAKNCDGVVLVVQSGIISWRFIRRVKEQLLKSGTRILGCVLNKVDIKNRSRYYGKGYYGKGYYGASYYGSAYESEEK